jgi:hypothetical protein
LQSEALLIDEIESLASGSLETPGTFGATAFLGSIFHAFESFKLKQQLRKSKPAFSQRDDNPNELEIEAIGSSVKDIHKTYQIPNDEEIATPFLGNKLSGCTGRLPEPGDQIYIFQDCSLPDILRPIPKKRDCFKYD